AARFGGTANPIEVSAITSLVARLDPFWVHAPARLAAAPASAAVLLACWTGWIGLGESDAAGCHCHAPVPGFAHRPSRAEQRAAPVSVWQAARQSVWQRQSVGPPVWQLVWQPPWRPIQRPIQQPIWQPVWQSARPLAWQWTWQPADAQTSTTARQ